jgi:hypothetical protein
MTGTERKRLWRRNHPEQSREAERRRAQARRNGYWNAPELGGTPRPCASSDSYFRYECSLNRLKQRMFWPRYGACTTRMTHEEFRGDDSGEARCRCSRGDSDRPTHGGIPRGLRRRPPADEGVCPDQSDPGDHVMPQTYEVTCSECRELRWPYLSERPHTYVCARCRSGVGAARREAGRKGASVKKSRRSQLQEARSPA